MAIVPETTDGLSPPGSPGSLGDATERAINLSLYRLGHLDARFLPEAERRWLEQNAKEASGEGARLHPALAVARHRRALQDRAHGGAR